MALFGVDVKDLGSAVGAIGTVAKDIRAAITGKSVIDPVAQAQIELGLQQLESAQMNAQAKVNEIEAASPNLFVSGWRPFIGWTCGLAIFYNFLVLPLLLTAGLRAVAIDTNELFPLILGMLGIGTMRTVEKFKGVARS